MQCAVGHCLPCGVRATCTQRAVSNCLPPLMGPLSANKEAVDQLVARMLATLTKGKTFGERCVCVFEGPSACVRVRRRSVAHMCMESGRYAALAAVFGDLRACVHGFWAMQHVRHKHACARP